MTAILISLVLLLQGIPIQQGGTVTGILRDTLGKPVAGIRMAAVARDTLDTAASAMAGIAETDEQGRFILENIPPGRYTIAAGRLDLQTYYPGTQAVTEATVLTIAPGSTISGINFALNDTSVGRASRGGFSIQTAIIPVSITAIIPVSVKVEQGGKLPVIANGKAISVSIESATSQFTVPVDGSSITVPGPIAGDFRVRVENLPRNYEVKSVVYGTTDITNGTFSLSAANFPSSAPSTTTLVTGPSSSQSSVNLPDNERDLLAYLEALGRVRGILPTGTTFITAAGQTASTFTATPGSVRPATAPVSPISITLGPSPLSVGKGARVSGKTGFSDKRTVFISGTPGTLFSDGSFEFHEVPPGRHLVATVDPYRPEAAVVVVGDKDIDGIELKQTLIPLNLQGPTNPSPAGADAPGTIIPLPRIAGTVVDEVTGMPIGEGSVSLRTPDYVRVISVDKVGRFETLPLFPGTYELSLWVFGHTSSSETVTVGDKDALVRLTSRKVE